MAQELGGSHPGLPTGDVFQAWCAVVTQLTMENDEPLFQVEYNYYYYLFMFILFS
jgi:hypothetical protein